MQQRPSHVWLLLIAIPVLVLGLLTYSLNQPPSPADVQRAVGASVHLDRLIRLGNQSIALFHTATTFNHVLITRRWGTLDVLGTGQNTADASTSNVTYSYRPLFHPGYRAQLLQGRVSTSGITSIQVHLDNGELVHDTINDMVFGIVYTGDQGLCTLDLLDVQQHMIEQIALKPFASNGADRRAYDCKP